MNTTQYMFCQWCSVNKMHHTGIIFYIYNTHHVLNIVLLAQCYKLQELKWGIDAMINHQLLSSESSPLHRSWVVLMRLTCLCLFVKVIWSHLCFRVHNQLVSNRVNIKMLFVFIWRRNVVEKTETAGCLRTAETMKVTFTAI